MPKHKAKNLVTQTKDELRDRLVLLRKEQFNLAAREKPNKLALVIWGQAQSCAY